MAIQSIPKQNTYPIGINRAHSIVLNGRGGKHERLIYQKKRTGRPYVLIRNGGSSFHTTVMRVYTGVAIGQKLPEGIIAHHDCHRQWCVNPAHIVLTYEYTHNMESLGHINDLPQELCFSMAECYPSDFGGNCIFIGQSLPENWDNNTCVRGDIPDIVKVTRFDEDAWAEFIDNVEWEGEILFGMGISVNGWRQP